MSAGERPLSTARVSVHVQEHEQRQQQEAALHGEGSGSGKETLIQVSTSGPAPNLPLALARPGWGGIQGLLVAEFRRGCSAGVAETHGHLQLTPEPAWAGAVLGSVHRVSPGDVGSRHMPSHVVQLPHVPMAALWHRLWGHKEGGMCMWDPPAPSKPGLTLASLVRRDGANTCVSVPPPPRP